MFQAEAASSNSKELEDFDIFLQRIFVQNKAHFNGNREMIEGLFELRDSLYRMVKSCADNVEIAIFVDHILDRPIVIKRGNCENRIRISIKSNGAVTHNWTKETWAKKLWDWFYGFLGLIEKFGKTLLSALLLIKKPIGFFSYCEIAIDVIKAICEKWLRIYERWFLLLNCKICLTMIYVTKSCFQHLLHDEWHLNK